MFDGELEQVPHLCEIYLCLSLFFLFLRITNMQTNQITSKPWAGLGPILGFYMHKLTVMSLKAMVMFAPSSLTENGKRITKRVIEPWIGTTVSFMLVLSVLTSCGVVLSRFCDQKAIISMQ